MNYGFVIDNRKCIGCHACTVACKSEHQVPLGVNRTHVKYLEKGVFPHSSRSFTVTRCNHCQEAPCVEICPTSSLFTRADGIVDFDSERCIGCKSCMQACPYDALYIDPATGTAAKCNYCAHRIENHYQPSCVVICPVQAIVSGDLDDPSSLISQLVSRHPVSVRKPEKGTRPNLYYVEGDTAALDPLASAPATRYLFTDQARGVGHFAARAKDRLNEAAERDLFPPSLQRELGGVSLAGGISVSQRAVDDVRRELGSPGAGHNRRVYDAPGKGILWDWQVPAYIWSKALATGIFLLLVLTGLFGDEPTAALRLKALVGSLLMMALTAGFLVLDLDCPRRFLYVLLRPNWRSWLVRGAWLIGGFSIVVAAMAVLTAVGRNKLAGTLEIPGLILAAGSAVYTAFLFAQARGRDSWQSPLAALRMLNHSLLAGCAAWVLLDAGRYELLSRALAVSISFNLLVLALEIWSPHASRQAALALAVATRGSDRFLLLAGILVGSVLPLAVLLAEAPPPLGQVAAVLVLGGIYLTEYVWVVAPQKVPLS